MIKTQFQFSNLHAIKVEPDSRIARVCVAYECCECKKSCIGYNSPELLDLENFLETDIEIHV